MLLLGVPVISPTMCSAKRLPRQLLRPRAFSGDVGRLRDGIRMRWNSLRPHDGTNELAVRGNNSRRRDQRTRPEVDNSFHRRNRTYQDLPGGSRRHSDVLGVSMANEWTFYQ